MFSARAGFSLAICKKSNAQAFKQTDWSIIKDDNVRLDFNRTGIDRKNSLAAPGLDPPKIGVTFGTECRDTHRQARDLPIAMRTLGTKAI
jgi:hypothetical protein